MISLEQCKKLINDKNITAEELVELREVFYESAQLAFEVYWQQENNGSKNPFGLLHHVDKKSKH